MQIQISTTDSTITFRLPANDDELNEALRLVQGLLGKPPVFRDGRKPDLRDVALQWLTDNDANGLYLDADRAAEGTSPLTLAEALSLILDQLAGGDGDYDYAADDLAFDANRERGL